MPTTFPVSNQFLTALLGDSSWEALIRGYPPGWAGRHHYVGAELLAGNYSVRWDEQGGLRLPFVVDREGAWTRLNNLHIHSKRLELFASNSIARKLPTDGS